MYIVKITSREMQPHEDEYEYQFYNFTQSSVVDGVAYVLDDVIRRVLNSMEKKLISSLKLDSDSVAKTKQSLHAAFSKSIDKNMDKLREIIRIYFTIPSNVILREDEIQLKQFTEVEELEIVKKLKTVKEKLAALSIMEGRLLSTCQSLETYKGLTEQTGILLEQADSLNTSFDKLLNNSSTKSFVAAFIAKSRKINLNNKIE